MNSNHLHKSKKIRNVAFILFLLFLNFLLNYETLSQTVVKECATPTWNASMGGTYDCITKCADLDITTEVSGFSGICSGKATVFKIKFYKIGFREQSSSTICWVWAGKIDLDFANLSAGITAATENLKTNCPSGTYDTIAFLTSRITQIAGHGTFPDGSEKIARSGPNHTGAQLNLDSGNTSLWLEEGTSYSDTGRNYTRISNTWNLPYKKAGTSPTSTDQTADTNTLHDIDEYKVEALEGVLLSDGVTYCEDAAKTACIKLDPSDSTRVIYTNKNDPGWVTGLPFYYDGVNIPSVEFSYVGRLSTDFRGGLEMVWYNNGGTAQFLGFQAKWDGIQIKIR